MTKADLVDRVSAEVIKTAGPLISRKDCARVIDTFLDTIKELLKDQQTIEMRGFGTFRVRIRQARKARNPHTGLTVEVAARPVPVFKPSKELKAVIAGTEIPNNSSNKKKS